ncbi:hypothetical protein [Phyllobacterium sp. 22552]|uniref:hypothetical protein n=1 Tax=Phyllobacterium sp. 22552 TaxID=3453941 RepID=UPI003F84D411
MARTETTRNIPRLGLNRTEVALAMGVAPNTVDAMVKEGALPPARIWHTRKFWRIAEIEAAMAEWPVDGEREADVSSWRASV